MPIQAFATASLAFAGLVAVLRSEGTALAASSPASVDQLLRPPCEVPAFSLQHLVRSTSFGRLVLSKGCLSRRSPRHYAAVPDHGLILSRSAARVSSATSVSYATCARSQ